MSIDRTNLQGDRTADSVIHALEEMREAHCTGCEEGLGAHQSLISIVMGFQDRPRCLLCLAEALNVENERFYESLLEHIRSRECYLGAWNWANRQAGLAENPFLRVGSETPKRMEDDFAVTFWDAGDMGCGDLVLELRLRLQQSGPGDVLKICAHDPGAPEDLPAWCRLTGHKLMRAEHPFYWIKRKE